MKNWTFVIFKLISKKFLKDIAVTACRQARFTSQNPVQKFLKCIISRGNKEHTTLVSLIPKDIVSRFWKQKNLEIIWTAVKVAVLHNIKVRRVNQVRTSFQGTSKFVWR